MVRTSVIAALFAAASTPAHGAPAPSPQESDPPGTGVATPTTLIEGQLWIRAVADPNFHKYLQTKPPNVPGTAILDSSTTAGQFNIVAGQLVNSVADPPLYMWVEEPDDPTNPPRTLSTWFNTTENPFGAFEFQGDTVTWSVASVERQNVAAWLVCTGQQLFVNTGAYAYETPAGCADQTVCAWNRDTDIGGSQLLTSWLDTFL